MIEPECIRCGGMARPGSAFCLTCAKGFDLENDVDAVAVDPDYESRRAHGEDVSSLARRDFTVTEIEQRALDLARKRGARGFI